MFNDTPAQNINRLLGVRIHTNRSNFIFKLGGGLVVIIIIIVVVVCVKKKNKNSGQASKTETQPDGSNQVCDIPF